MLTHGVGCSADGCERHLTHLTQEVDCRVLKRKKQNACGPNATKNKSMLYDSAKSNYGTEVNDGADDCVDDYVDRCVDGPVDGSVNIAKDDERKKQNACGLNARKNRSGLYDSAKSNDGKE
eukprot:9795803-Ditylum_brightwellii.AAC.1